MTAEKLDLARLTASEVVALTRSGKVTVEEYAKALIARVQARDDAVKAWAYFNPELILASARALDAIPAEERGPLHGVAIGVKDVINTKDMPTQHNSPIYVNDQPGVDAGPVNTLRASGALIFGKTTTTEFATCQAGPPTCNPHDPSRTAGGSSSGSGAAVGDFEVPIALGTQTGGSTIRPGAFNGIFAIKPTWNAISREGLKMYSISCDTLGLYARSAEDLKLLLEVFRLADDVAPAPAVDVKGAKFGFVKTSVWPKALKGTQNAFALGKKLLEEAGAEVEDVELPEDFAKVPEWHRWILSAEGRSSFLGDYLNAYSGKLVNPFEGKRPIMDKFIAGHVDNDAQVTRKMLLEAYDGIARLRPVIDEIAARFDALITPSVTDEAPVAVEPIRFTGDASFNLIWTVLHTPVVNVPGFKGETGLPIGLSLVGPRYGDQKLVDVASRVGAVWKAGGGFVLKI